MTIEEAIDILTDNRIFTHACGYTEEEQGQALDMAIRSLEAWEKVKAEITEIRDDDKVLKTLKYIVNTIGAKNHDISDDYADGRHDVACESLRIIDKHLKEVEE